MKLDTFFDNFSLLADAPHGVQKLRETILQLAVQGKLVPQDPKDEPASFLLEKIQAEKERLVKEKKIKKIKLLPPINPEKTPYEVPDSWEWTRLTEIGLINPRNDVGNEAEVSFVPMKLVPTILGDRVESEIRQWGDIKNGFTHFAEGDVAIAKITPCFQNRKSAVMRGLKNGLGAGTTELHIFRPVKKLIIPDYVLLYLKTPKFIREGVSKMTGSAGQKRVPKSYFSETPFPLPPINEQKRIVAKVDELMSLCDELEARKQQVSKNCIQLNDASIHKLLTAHEPKKFNKHWQRIYGSFDLLYSKPENVNKLRQAVLQLAVQGKLVRQDPKDEPASVLLEKIKADKEKLIKEGKIKKPKSLPPIDPNEVPYELPRRWEWTRLGHVLNKLTDGTHHSPPNDSIGDYMYITAKNIKSEGVSLEDVTYVSKKKHKEIFTRCDVEFGDILYIKDGATTGVATINTLEEQFSMLSSVALLKPPKMLYNRFLLYLLRSPYYYSLMREGMSGVAITRVTLTKLNNSLIPLSPLPEQKRIVAKVDELMALCDELETRLSQSQTDCDRLMEAAVAEILAA